jgi:lysophospholipase L1-like esterase
MVKKGDTMPTTLRAALGALVLWSCVARCAERPAAGPPRLTLPPAVYAVAGREASIYYDNVVLAETPGEYRFQVRCKLGRQETRRWVVSPRPTDAGQHRFSIAVEDKSGRRLGRATTTLCVAPADAGHSGSIKLLVIGDSLTAAAVYPAEMGRLLSQPGNPVWEMLGSNRGAGPPPTVAHEGYGGWTWARFVSHYDAQADPKGNGRSSPFVFLGRDGKPVLDPSRYFRTVCQGHRPDYVTIMLGINDCFGLNPEDPRAIDAGVDQMFQQAEVFLAALRKDAPKAQLGVCLVTPPNARESGFEANYQGHYHRWGWKRIQHRLVERQLAQFGGREKENIFLVPTELDLDPDEGYPVDNAVHPNQRGYQQIASAIYAWLKWRMNGR